MTKQRIEQYSSLKREIAMLADQIDKAESSGELVADSVKGSTSEIPYVMHNVTIKGYATHRVPKLHRRKAVLEGECEKIEAFIWGLDDSLIRQIMTWRFIEGKQMGETAKLVGYSVSQVKRLINHCFEKMT